MSTIRTTMTAEAQDLLAKQQAVATGAAGITNEYRRLTSESQRLNSAAKRAFEESRTPLERYNNRVQQLNELLRKGKIDQDTHARSVERAKQKFDDASQAGAGLSTVFGKLTGFAGGFLSVASGIGFVVEQLRSAREEAERSAELLKEGFASRGELAQVVQGRTPAEMRADLQSLREQAAAFRTQGGIESEELANQIVFALRSTGLEKDAETFRSVGRVGLVSQQAMPQLINSLDSLKDAFTQAETGNVEQMLSKALIASAASQKPAQQLLSATAKAGASAKALGFGDEETLAGIALLTDPLGSSDEAATRMRSLFKSLEKQQIQARTLGDALDQISARVAGGANITDVLGEEQEAIQGFRLLQTVRDQFGTLTRDIQRGSSGQALRQRVQVLGTDLQQRAGMLRSAVQGAVDVGREPLGTRESVRQSMVTARDELLRELGYNAVTRGVQRIFHDSTVMRVFQDPNRPLVDQQLAEQFRREGEGNPRVPALLEKLLDAQQQLLELNKMDRQERAEKERADKARQTPRPNVPRPEA